MVNERFVANALCGWSLSRSPDKLPDRRPRVFEFQWTGHRIPSISHGIEINFRKLKVLKSIAVSLTISFQCMLKGYEIITYRRLDLKFAALCL